MDGVSMHQVPCKDLQAALVIQAQESARLADLEEHRRRLNGSIERLTGLVDRHLEATRSDNQATESRLLHALSEMAEEVKDKADKATVTALEKKIGDVEARVSAKVDGLADRILYGGIALLAAQVLIQIVKGG